MLEMWLVTLWLSARVRERLCTRHVSVRIFNERPAMVAMFLSWNCNILQSD